MNGNEKLRVGFVTIWFERGQSYVTRVIRDAIAGECETYIFARTGGVFGQPKLETKGFWDVPNLTTFPDYNIPGRVLAAWIEENRLDAVIFNEEYDWGLIEAAKAAGTAVITYLDYYKEDWKPKMALYDAVLCSSRRAYNLVRDICPAHYMGWAVDANLFKPRPSEGPQYTFFHNAGWLGIGFRKMTPACLLAFDAVCPHLPEDVRLLVHAQTELEKLPPPLIQIVKNNPRITYRAETVPAPGLYHLGRVLVFPTKLEGLGLPLFEALAAGLPVISTNAPPMNEYIQDGETGLLVEVARRITRQDNISFPEELISVNDLAVKMAWLAARPDEIARMSENARRYAEEELQPAALGRRVLDVLHQMAGRTNTARRPIAAVGG